MTLSCSNIPLTALQFDNQFVRQLPADRETANYSRQVANACYSWVQPKKAPAPRLVCYAPEVAELLELSAETCSNPLFLQVFTGNALLDGMQPYATCYGGHQFGQWAGQLGDGRAINLGEVVNSQGQHWTLQLKGAGKTPYSRHADGLAVLRSSVREFLCSEAMHHLGIPTTRALSLTLTGETVIRDMFYDGRPKEELGAVVCRVAPSFTRFGSFQIFAARNDKVLLKQLLDYTIRRDFPELGSPCVATYLRWFAEVCTRTATLIVHWQRVGFVHGVMNTDNMSILGLTIDYGPYGWLENYDPNWTPNTTDAQYRRYCFGNQPQIALWNLTQLANAIYPLIEDAEPLQAALRQYSDDFARGWETMMAEKLGLQAYQASSDERLIDELLAILAVVETDMTLFYRQLATIDWQVIDFINITDDALLQPLLLAYYAPDDLTAPVKARIGRWLRHYAQRLQRDNTPFSLRQQRMNAVNPHFVLRNYLAQLAIDKAEQGDFSLIAELLAVLRHPYTEQPAYQAFAQKRPDWAKARAGCSMLSCSS
jgi:uncharacterized protein YdiU (UPF0061 family)